MVNKYKNRVGITFIEVVIAALLIMIVLLPVFNFLTNSVKETERIYVEVMATSRAKRIMDTILFQIPWRALREGNPCVFADPLQDDPVKQGYPEVQGTAQLFDNVIQKMMGDGCELDGRSFRGDGLIKDPDKGFWFRTRVKVEDLDKGDIVFKIGGREFNINQISSKDADGKYNLVKKIVVQIKWSLLKETDPNDDPRAKTMFLVGFKSNLEG